MDHKDQKQSIPTKFDTQRPIGSYIEIIIILFKNPNLFFANLDKDEDYYSPSLFALISFLIPAIYMFISSGSIFILKLFSMAMISWMIFLGLVHLSVTKLFAGQGNFADTFRVAVYTTCFYIVSPFPYIGIAAQLFSWYLTAIGMAIVHRIPVLQASMSLGVVVGGQILLVIIWLSSMS